MTTTTSQQKQILAFLKTQLVGVISSISADGLKPASALVAFSETDGLELIFGTFNDTRKFANIVKNPAVSFVISSGDVTIQYEGRAALAEGAEAIACRDIHLRKNPGAKKYAFEAKQRFFRITPAWIRFSDLSARPENVFEVVFPSMRTQCK